MLDASLRLDVRLQDVLRLRAEGKSANDIKDCLGHQQSQRISDTR